MFAHAGAVARTGRWAGVVHGRCCMAREWCMAHTGIAAQGTTSPLLASLSEPGLSRPPFLAQRVFVGVLLCCCPASLTAFHAGVLLCWCPAGVLRVSSRCWGQCLRDSRCWCPAGRVWESFRESNPADRRHVHPMPQHGVPHRTSTDDSFALLVLFALGQTTCLSYCKQAMDFVSRNPN